MRTAVQDVYLLDATKLHGSVCLHPTEDRHFEALEQLRLDLSKALASQNRLSPSDRLVMDRVNLLYRDAKEAVMFALLPAPKEV